MENKKGSHLDTSNIATNEFHHIEQTTKHLHQHNTVPQHLQLLQYGLKVPNHQHSQTNQQQSLNSTEVYLHLHQYQQPLYQSERFVHSSSQQDYSSQYQCQGLQPLHQHQLRQPIQLHPSSSSPSSLNHYGSLNQQNSQTWISRQPQYHYHQATTECQAQKSINNQSHQQKFKDEKKKHVGNSNQQLRSPIAKRPQDAPVTMQGWLHKQGSDGLMLWRKRWFVLSEYCLYYYKGNVNNLNHV